MKNRAGLKKVKKATKTGLRSYWTREAVVAASALRRHGLGVAAHGFLTGAATGAGSRLAHEWAKPKLDRYASAKYAAHRDSTAYHKTVDRGTLAARLVGGVAGGVLAGRALKNTSLGAHASVVSAMSKRPAGWLLAGLHRGSAVLGWGHGYFAREIASAYRRKVNRR